jgi:plasmid stabilization system protein ParE
MIIKFEDFFLEQFNTILTHISQDKKSAAYHFKKSVQKKITLLKEYPFMCRKSYYFEDKAYRDLIHQGYTVIYKVEDERIIILEIFKWQNR